VNRAAVLAALASALLFGAATPASKALLGELTPLGLAGLLYLGAAIATAWPALSRKRIPLRWAPSRSRWMLVGAVILGGIVGPALLLFGLNVAQAGSVSLWLNLELVATALLGHWFFRDHLGKYGWAAAVLVLSGALIVSAQADKVAWIAAGLVAGACLCWGLDNHWTALIDGLHPVQSTFWKGLVGGTFNLVLAFWLQPFPASWPQIGLALLVGAFSYGVSIGLYIHSAQSLGATRAQLVFSTAPLWGLAGSAAVLHETLAWAHFAAICLMAGGIALLYREKHEHVHAHDVMEHSHSHRHDDGHHDHPHPGLPASMRHTHWHRHEAVTHKHPHWPDLHHRHHH
jgi:drug/metabolite transporter (DMT)-like permease